MHLYKRKVTDTIQRSFAPAVLLVMSLYIYGCKETEIPENPYAAVDYSSGSSSEPTPDPHSIQGLHKNIFSVKCALSGCHDGTFEPDFRTVQSAYASLVYQPVIKNTVNNVDTFFIRVVPFNHLQSFIYERITTPTLDYMPSNGTRLSSSEINDIAAWIDAGAKDENGNVPVKPNLQPNILFYVAIDTTFQVRYDTSRVAGFALNPFIIPGQTPFYIAYFPSDTLDGTDATPVPSLLNCRVKFSTDKNDFTNAQSIASIYAGANSNIWLSAVNSNLWPGGTTVYFRIYVNDGDHAADAEFPRNESPDYYKTIYAFYVQ